VRLQVADLARSLAFYDGVLGLLAADQPGAHAAPGSVALAAADGRVLIELVERRGARPAPRRSQLGLYHFAVLLPDRGALGRLVRHLGKAGVRAGASDHAVSEALYLTDPDGLGVEVYADRPRSTWRRTGRELVVTTEALDVPALVAAAGSEPWAGVPAGTGVGHLHLHVGDLAQASDFYAEAMGFDRMAWMYPGALFLGAGGYHHHVGTNTWAGPGAGPPSDGDAQLLEWTVELPAAADVEAVAASLARAGYAAERDGGMELVTRDPWGTAVRVRAAVAV
jgi:catechol 2,3-dioxygenase